MKKLLLSLILFISFANAYAQPGSLSQSVYRSRVNDSTDVSGNHGSGYADIYWNNNATTPHWDIWNGSSYDHVFDFNSGTGPSGTVTTRNRLEPNIKTTSFTLSLGDTSKMNVLDNVADLVITLDDFSAFDHGIQFAFYRKNGTDTVYFDDGGETLEALSLGITEGAYAYLYYNPTDNEFYLSSGGGGSGGGGGTTYSFSSPLSESAGTVSIANAAADGSTKGAASFTANDFNATTGNISIDYTNGQAATSGQKGFLTSTDWSTFNGKQSTITFGTGIQTALGVNVGSVGAPVLFNGALGTPSSGTGTNITGITAANVVVTPAGNISSTNAGAAINELDAEKSDVYITLNTQTSNYTGVLTDAGKKVLMNSASANTFTFPPNSSVAYPVGTRIIVTQIGVGITSALAGAGVTLNNSAPTLAISDQYASLVGTKTATDTWLIENGTASGVSAAALTRVDDTNVTLTLGGAPSTALLSATSITAGWTGQLSATRGGTGFSNATQTYTPTLTNSANIAASTANVCQYFRVGNVVTVSGVVSIDPTTTATLTTLGISLPIASNFTTAVQAGGTAVAYAVAGSSAGIFSDATNDRVTLQLVPTDVTNQPFAFTFTYQVL